MWELAIGAACTNKSYENNLQLQLLHQWLGHDLDYCDIEWFALETEIIVSFLRLHPSTAFQTFLLTMRDTPFLLRNSCSQ